MIVSNKKLRLCLSAYHLIYSNPQLSRWLSSAIILRLLTCETRNELFQTIFILPTLITVAAGIRTYLSVCLVVC